MHPKSLSLLGLFLLLGIPAADGQTARITTDSDLMNFMNSDLDYIRNRRERYASVEGSAYLDSAFTEGTISVGGKRYEGIPLRFNPYEDAFEFKNNDEVRYFIPQSARTDTVWLGGEVFLNVVRRDGKNLKPAFMILAGGERSRVLVFHQVRLTEPQPARGYDEAKPATFVQMPDEIFIQLPGKPAVEFKGKKSLEEVFGEDHEELEKFAKSHKLRLKTPEEAVALCTEYDSGR